jgi:hypothetical protein
MASTSSKQMIQDIYSFHENIRNPKIPPSILLSIESIQRMIGAKPEQPVVKKVEWRRNENPVPQTGNRFFGRDNSYHEGRAKESSFHEGRAKESSFHEGRAKESSFHESRNRKDTRPFTRPKFFNKEPPLSIPLTSGFQKESEEKDSFQVVTRPSNRYVSKFTKSAEKVEDTILNKILLGKLNKFSASNYPEIKEFITHIISNGQTEMIKCFMKIVFEKAASEEVFCPLYARLLSDLTSQYPVLLNEMNALYEQYMEIFEEVADGSMENYNELCKRNVQKKYRRGYSQFLAELIKFSIVDVDTFMRIITKIIQQVRLNLVQKDSIKLMEEFADCLMKIVKAIQSTNENDEEDEKQELMNQIRQRLKTVSIHDIKEFSVAQPLHVGLSNKARFTFLDMYEAILKM